MTLGMLVAALSAGCSSPVGKYVTEQGYTATVPPTTLYSPGTLVYYDEKAAIPFGLVCTQQQSLGADLQLETSASQTEQVSEMSKGEFNLEAKYLDYISGNAKAKVVKSVTMKFDNVRVLALSTATIFNTVKKRDAGCEKSIKFYESKGARISMVTEVIQASVMYDVVFESNADASVQAQYMQQFAAKMGGKVDTKSQTTVTGEGLFWGLREDAELAKITPADGVRDVPRNKRIVPVQLLEVDVTLPSQPVATPNTDPPAPPAAGSQ
jgi:hypothetical protein